MKRDIPSNEIHEVISACTVVWDESARDILGRKRFEPLVEARQSAMTILRGRGYSLHAVARAMRRGDHGTVMWANMRVGQRLEWDKKFIAKWTATNSILKRGENHPCNRVRIVVDALLPGHQGMDNKEILAAVAEFSDKGSPRLESVEVIRP